MSQHGTGCQAVVLPESAQADLQAEQGRLDVDLLPERGVLPEYAAQIAGPGGCGALAGLIQQLSKHRVVFIEARPAPSRSGPCPPNTQARRQCRWLWPCQSWGACCVLGKLLQGLLHLLRVVGSEGQSERKMRAAHGGRVAEVGQRRGGAPPGRTDVPGPPGRWRFWPRAATGPGAQEEAVPADRPRKCRPAAAWWGPAPARRSHGRWSRRTRTS